MAMQKNYMECQPWRDGHYVWPFLKESAKIVGLVDHCPNKLAEVNAAIEANTVIRNMVHSSHE